MSTAPEVREELVDEAFERIGVISSNVPINTTLLELQLVVERLTFSGLFEREDQTDRGTMAEIELFFRDAVSSGMVGFIRWMAENNGLGALGGEPGRIFLDRCMSEYRKIQEVQVVTAIDLSDEHRTAIAEQLREVHPSPARILFTTNPSIIAGFIVNVGNSTIDKSLRNHVATTVPRSSRFDALINDTKEQVNG